MPGKIIRRLGLALALIVAASGAFAQLPGRVSPLPGLTGLGSNALPGLISPQTSAAAVGLPAGTATVGRWNPLDKSANITLSNGNRTAVNPSTAAFAGARGNLSFNTLTMLAPIYVEFVIDSIGTGTNDEWRIGFGNSSVVLDTSTGGFKVLTGSLSSSNVAGRTVSIGTGWNSTPNMAIANGDTVQVLIYRQRFWWGLNGQLSQLDVTKTDATASSAGIPIYWGMGTDTLFIYVSLFFSAVTNPQVSIPAVTAYPAPPGAIVY